MPRKLVLLVSLLALVPPGSARAAVPDYVRPVKGPIIRHFEAPPSPYGPGHRGIDLGVPTGTTVVAAAGGRVSFAGQVGGALFVSVDHPDGHRTTYSFLAALLVRAGQEVEQGDAVARSGTCHPGSTEPCLHFGVRNGDEYLDPEPILLASMRRNLWRVIRLSP